MSAEKDQKMSDSRSRVLSSATELFAAKGYNGVSTAEIAREAEVSEAMLFKHFKSKKGLLHAVLQDIVEVRLPAVLYYRMDEPSLEALKTATLEDLKAFIRDKFLRIHDNVRYAKVLFLEMQYHEDIRDAYMGHLAPNMVRHMTGVFDLWKSIGLVRQELDSRTAIRSLAGMLNFAILDKTVISRDMDLEQEFDKVLDIYFRGVLSLDAIQNSAVGTVHQERRQCEEEDA